MLEGLIHWRKEDFVYLEKFLDSSLDSGDIQSNVVSGQGAT